MAGKARLLARVIREYLAQDVDRQSMLAEQMQAFREVLIHDTTPEDFSRAEAASLIPKTDPILHFYEDFLAAYNSGLRKQRGVWYTPQPVVGFIVRSVDRILEAAFGLQGGLANNSKAKFKVVNDNRFRKSDAAFVEREMHRVQILDPACSPTSRTTAGVLI